MTFCVQAGWDDVPHLSAIAKAALLSSYPEHEREARAKGVPMLGSGAVFPIDEARIKCEPRQIPSFWPQIVGLDFGWDHPTAGVLLAWDRDGDVLYVTKEYRRAKEVPIIHAGAVRAWGGWQPVAWPHDGLQHDKGSGEQLKEQYRAAGLEMLADQASHEAGGNGVEAGISEMYERMRTDRLKIFSDCGLWFEEFRTYHRADGKIVKERDDLMAATRYAVMMRRYARANTTYADTSLRQRVGTVV
jgi:hypothetical protein